jgi:hypothetical protein
METGTERSNGKLTTWQPSPSSSEISVWLAEQLVVLAEATGENVTPARLKIYAADLADLGRSQLEVAFARARRELKFFPRIAELRELAGSSVKQSQDAEGRKCWDILTAFVARYVSNDVYGGFGPEHGWYPKTFPKLSDRILDTVRRTGGWKVYACMTEEDFPFVQKRFFEEYAAWTAVERVDVSKLLAEMPQLRLIAKSIDAPRRVETNSPTFKAKSIPEPLTDAQLRDRREILRQQAAALGASA